MTDEIARLTRLLASANDKGTVEYQIARTYAAGGQYPEALSWLQKVVQANYGFDPFRDPLFARFNASIKFWSLLHQVRANTPAVSRSRSFATVPETDLFPENFAFDVVNKDFFIGSTLKEEIVRCQANGPCAPFVTSQQNGLGSVLGLKIHPESKTLWATSNTSNGASLRHYRLAMGELIQAYSLAGTHLFNDLAVSYNGDVFVTDTREGAVYKLGADTQLRKIAASHGFTAANGVALSYDQKLLYVADFGDGIAVVDLSTESVIPMPHPPDVCLGYIDGLYATKDSLVAIQNGYMLPRIVRFRLSKENRAIVAVNVLERRNPSFDGITTGFLTGRSFYYIANPQLDKVVDGRVKPNQQLNALKIFVVRIE